MRRSARSFLRRLSRTIVAATVVLCATKTASAQKAAQDLANVSLEDLMKVTITSASRREQSVIDTAAAVYVITRDDIRRSGLTSVPELLRLAPGVQIARIDGNKWAVAVRGFNFRWSNKLLVLIDGRTVYNRLLSGVFWDMIQLPVEVIDRIEVIRGPGASVWGANAVDGVINILTLPAAETRGGLVRASAGMLGAAAGTGQWSGRLGDGGAYRLYGQWSDRGHGLLPDSRDPGGDDSRSGTGGVRVDWAHNRDALMFESDSTRGRSGTRQPIIAGPLPPTGGWPTASWLNEWSTSNALARWTHTTTDHSSLQAQVFADRLHRAEPTNRYGSTTFDMDLTYRTKLGRHELITGGAHRLVDDSIDGTFAYSVTPANADIRTSNLFAQDEISLAKDRLRLTLGSKFEHDTLGGWSVQPTARLLWKPSARQRVWTAVSGASRTPARVDRGLQVIVASFMGAQGLPLAIALRGNPEYTSERLHAWEAGYRLDLSPSLSLDVSTFLNHYTGLQTFTQQPPVLMGEGAQHYLFVAQQFGNDMRAVTRGLEASASWRPVHAWRLDGNVSTFHLTPHPNTPTTVVGAAGADGNAPGYQWRLQSGLLLGSRLTMDATVFGVGALKARVVGGYQRVDAQVTWKVSRALSLSAAGQNLVGHGHLEFGGIDNAATLTLGSRTARAELTWHIR